MKPTVLVTGGAGYLGSHIARSLSLQGWPVVVLDTLAHGQTWTHSWATFVKGDASNARLLNQMFTQHKIKYVVHGAIATNVEQSLSDPLSMYRNNVGGSIVLLDAMRKHKNAGLIFLSSIAVHGTPPALPIQEDHPIRPATPYAQSLAHIEQIIRDAHVAYGLPCVVLRSTNVAGAAPEHNLREMHKPETHVVPTLLSALHTEKPFYLFGCDYQTQDGSCVRDFLHVWDIADAVGRSIKHLDNNLPSETFILGTGVGTSIKELVAEAETLFNRPIRTKAVHGRPYDPPALIVDAMHAQTVLGWRPAHSTIPFILQSAHVLSTL